MKIPRSANISILVLMACFIQVFNPASFGQSSPADASRKIPSNSRVEEKSLTYAPVGPSGYKVLIPEIKMNQIIGDVKPKPQVAEPAPDHTDKASKEDAGQSTKETSSDLADTTAIEAEVPVTRLPFDRGDRKISPSPPQPGLSHDLKRTIDSDTHLLGPPLAPMNITEALPEPKKDLFPKRQLTTVPKIKELQTTKIQPQVFQVKPLRDQNLLAPEDWVGLQTRKSPAELPLKEPTSETVVKTPLSEPSETTENLVRESIEEEKEDKRQPVSETSVASLEREKRAVQEPKDDAAEMTKDETAISMAPKEQIPSPLDDRALTEKGMRLYLSETTPVIEELSLLMARTPSLSLADYDPSEINTSMVSQDLNLRLESMKRELRILDSKIFSIIPPSNYLEFHNLIRQSISHTYLACEAISNYFQDSKLEDLQKVNEHLIKARELIQLTRKTNGST